MMKSIEEILEDMEEFADKFEEKSRQLSHKIMNGTINIITWIFDKVLTVVEKIFDFKDWVVEKWEKVVESTLVQWLLEKMNNSADWFGEVIDKVVEWSKNNKHWIFIAILLVILTGGFAGIVLGSHAVALVGALVVCGSASAIGYCISYIQQSRLKTSHQEVHAVRQEADTKTVEAEDGAVALRKALKELAEVRAESEKKQEQLDALQVTTDTVMIAQAQQKVDINTSTSSSSSASAMPAFFANQRQEGPTSLPSQTAYVGKGKEADVEQKDEVEFESDSDTPAF